MKALGFCRAHILCFHQCTSVDAYYIDLAPICSSQTTSVQIHTSNIDNPAITEVKLLPASVTAMETESDPRALDALQA